MTTLPNPHQPGPGEIAGYVKARLARAGLSLRAGTLPEIGRGADNIVLAAHLHDGTPVAIRCRTGARPPRYATAAWASAQLTAIGVAVPQVLWHDNDICVETRSAGHGTDVLGQYLAAAAGGILRAVHEVPVRGYGPLDGTGHGPHPTLAGWLTSRPAAYQLRAIPGSSAITNRLDNALHRFAPSLISPGPRLLHGDWVARHVLGASTSTSITVTGILDLESVRGGDPLADLAGWSLQEPAHLTRALFTGYRLHTGSHHVRLRLVLHRLRIATALAAHHHRVGQQARCDLHLAQIRADLDDLDGGALRSLPLITPARQDDTVASHVQYPAERTPAQ